MTAAHQPSSSRLLNLAETAIARYRALPRVGKWIAIASVGFGSFLLLDSVFWPLADEYNTRADRLAIVLARAGERAKELPNDVVIAAVAYGPNSAISAERQAKERLAAAIDDVLRSRRIVYGLDIRQPQALPAGSIPGAATQADESVARTIVDLRFEAPADTVAEVISSISASPAIDAIGDLRLTYNAQLKRVGVQMTIETWATIRKTARGGA